MSPIKTKVSSNCSSRKSGTIVDTIIIHHTNMSSCDEALSRLCDPDSSVSAHYLIHKNGLVHQLVEEKMKAWHAGVSFWRGRGGINDYSIGIELDNAGMEKFPNQQMVSLIALCKEVVSRWPIEQRNVLAHADIAPNRKDDPNIYFNWQVLAEHGIGLFAPYTQEHEQTVLLSFGDEGELVIKLKSALIKYGYMLNENSIYDEQLEQVVTAFKRHYVPSSYYYLGWDSHCEEVLVSLLNKIYS